jgi:hypothetical protein
LFLSFCAANDSSSNIAIDSDSTDVFTGSTPGDELIKSLLAIHPSKKVDFIRWNLTLNKTKTDKKTFILNIVFGEAQPNTLGFYHGGTKLIFEDEYTITQNKSEGINGEIIHLKSSKLPSEIKMIKLNDNLFHLLTPENQLMVGNGGWSYTLNCKDLDTENTILPALTNSTDLTVDTAQQVVFEGRTPCRDFAAEHNMTVTTSCFKLKWRITLKRDPVSNEPTTYTMRKVVDNEPRDVSGNWKIIKGTAQNPDVVIYQLDYNKPGETISLLVGDQNVLFFLHPDNRLFVGNENFSFTLNKKTTSISVK